MAIGSLAHGISHFAPPPLPRFLHNGIRAAPLDTSCVSSEHPESVVAADTAHQPPAHPPGLANVPFQQNHSQPLRSSRRQGLLRTSATGTIVRCGTDR